MEVISQTYLRGAFTKDLICLIEGDATECEDEHPMGRPTKEDSYFIELPLEPQLKMIEENSEIFGACRKQVLECTEEASSYKDITDGTLYKNFYKEVHSESGDRTCCHLSLIISTDEAHVFKSIQCSIWPLYLYFRSSITEKVPLLIYSYIPATVMHTTFYYMYNHVQ